MPRPSGNLNDPNLLEAALEGLLLQKQRLEAQIQEVRALLGKKRMAGSSISRSSMSGASLSGESAPPPDRKRELSDAARKRIAAAQKKRWAEYRKQRLKSE